MSWYGSLQGRTADVSREPAVESLSPAQGGQQAASHTLHSSCGLFPGSVSPILPFNTNQEAFPPKPSQPHTG